MATTQATLAQVLRDVREFARHPFAFHGGYPKVLFMIDGACLCAACAKANYRQISQSTRHCDRDGWRAAGVDVHWEGPALHCDQCGERIESAYGAPDAE